MVSPVQATRLLDRSLVYTAITRATDLAVLVGDPEVLRNSLERTRARRPAGDGALSDVRRVRVVPPGLFPRGVGQIGRPA